MKDSVQDYIDLQVAPTRLDSHGEFSWNWENALAKLGSYQLNGPTPALWKLVQAAVGWGSGALFVVEHGRELTVYLEAPEEVALEEWLEQISARILQGKPSPERDLMVALAYWREQPLPYLALSRWAEGGETITWLHRASPPRRLPRPPGRCNFGIHVGMAASALKLPFLQGVYYAPMSVYWNGEPLGRVKNTPFFSLDDWVLVHMMTHLAFLLEFHRQGGDPSTGGYGVRPLGAVGKLEGTPADWTGLDAKNPVTQLLCCQGKGEWLPAPTQNFWQRITGRQSTMPICTGSLLLGPQVKLPHGRIFPVQRGVFLEPIDWPELELGAWLVLAVDNLESDLGEFQLRRDQVEGHLLPRARQLTREAVTEALDRLDQLKWVRPPNVLKYFFLSWVGGACVGLTISMDLFPLFAPVALGSWGLSCWWEQAKGAPARLGGLEKALRQTLQQLGSE